MRSALWIALLLSLQGCWFIYIPAGLFSGPGAQSKLDTFTQDIESKGPFHAVAVAKDANQWAYGGYYGAPSPQAASDNAIEQCNKTRQSGGVASACHLYRVNGLPYAGR